MTDNLSYPSPLGASTKEIEHIASTFREANKDLFENGNTDILIRNLGGRASDDLQRDHIWSVDESHFFFPHFEMLGIRAREKQYANIIGLQAIHAPLFRRERPGVIMRVNSSEPSLKAVLREAIIFGNELTLPHKEVLELYDQGGCDAVRYELKTGFLSTKEIEDRVEYARAKLDREDTPTSGSPAP